VHLQQGGVARRQSQDLPQSQPEGREFIKQHAALCWSIIWHGA
jgi:hypothetical protein